jgi:sugar lactone lactonase YvrE
MLDVAAERRNILGEGPLWDAGSGRLYWVDIKGRLIEWLEPASGRAGHWLLACRPSALALRSRGGLLVATDRGLAVFDVESGMLTPRLNPEPDKPHNRSNDGHADAQGRFWLGTMDDREQAATGALYRLDPDWTCTLAASGFGIPNGQVMSPDERTLYVAESKSGVIWAYRLDSGTGELGDRRVFADLGGDGSPDGMAVDAEGFLWNAHWGAWRVVRYAPDGRLDRTVDMPVEQPSSCAFGGDDLATLYVTSAREGLSEEALAKQPLAGSLFAFRPGVRGLPTPAFAG